MDQRDLNAVSALCLNFVDELGQAVAVFAPRNEPAQAIAYIGRAPSLTIRQLSGLLGLSHAATVRLVDRMCVDDLVSRRPSKEDGRAVELNLTAQGQERYKKMLNARSTLVKRRLSLLNKKDQAAFVQLARRLLSSRVYSAEDAARGCRFCDVEACYDCPVRTGS
ncbi:MarR family winged helix-turn-helix transcriptional regulator [Roseobacter sinensis]|uniref:MarR family winged helix-turn-helix transcriptional regulator n=1 Tax=Roseobacter sinensis TaxID=2931391 RepID=UPI00385098B7